VDKVLVGKAQWGTEPGDTEPGTEVVDLLLEEVQQVVQYHIHLNHNIT